MTSFETDLHMEATELRLGLPGAARGIKRVSPEIIDDLKIDGHPHPHPHPPPKEQIVGWPPVRSYRKNCMEAQKRSDESSGMFVKVSMDGAPYLRKIDLKVYKGYPDLVKALEIMFKCTIDGYNGSEYTTTYEDKDGDWMLAGDVPWEMFVRSCNRVRIMRGSEAKGLTSNL